MSESRSPLHGSWMNAVNRVAQCCVVAMLLVVGGCSNELRTSYGPNKGILAKRSVNGFTTLRDSFGNAGCDQRELRRLTDRARSMSVVVWTPTHPTGIGIDTTRWFERWLKQGHRTLIYVIPDSGSATEFYRDARPVAPPGQRLEYRRRYAEGLIDEHQWQLNRTPVVSNGWFAQRPKVQRSGLEISESYQEQFAERAKDWHGTTESIDRRQFEWVIEEFDPGNAAQQGTVIWAPVGPGDMPWMPNSTAMPTTTEIEFQGVLESEDGDALVARITSDDWDGSQIFVVSAGSMLTNYGLTRPANQQLAGQLIERSLQAVHKGGQLAGDANSMRAGDRPMVGFATANGTLPISARGAEVPRATGAEMLTVFPISFVTIHIAVLGFAICLMLMPVFGRPKPVFRGVMTHFGDHLDAVATLMRRRGGEHYARRRISDYMKQVRQETVGPWVIDEPERAAQSSAPVLGQIATPPSTSEPSETKTTTTTADPSGSSHDSNQIDRG